MFMYLQNRTPTKTNEGTTPYERFYGTNRTQDTYVARMRGEGYTTQGGAREAGRSGSGVPVWGRLSVWVPRIRVREGRDVTFNEGPLPCCLTIDPSQRSKM